VKGDSGETIPYGELRGESFDVNEEIVVRSVGRMLDAMLE